MGEILWNCTVRYVMCSKKLRGHSWYLKTFCCSMKSKCYSVWFRSQLWNIEQWSTDFLSALRTVVQRERYQWTFCFSRYLFNLFVWQTSQTLLTPGVLLHMCKVQRSAWACVWVVGPSGIKPTSCVTDSNSLVFYLTHSHITRLRFLSLLRLRWTL